MATGSSTRRAIYLIALVLGLAPMTSLYNLVATTTSSSIDDTMGDEYDVDPINLISLVGYTFEEDESSIFRVDDARSKSGSVKEEGALWNAEDIVVTTTTTHSISSSTSVAAALKKRRASYHRKMAISFLVPAISFFLLLSVPCSVWFYGWMKRKFGRILFRSAPTSRQRRGRESLCRQLRPCTTILSEDDRVRSVCCDRDAVYSIDDDRGKMIAANKNATTSNRWKLPIAGTLLMPEKEQKEERQKMLYREVEGECAICLGQFFCGDSVVWSSNADCLHCFHHDCILSWLLQERQRRRRRRNISTDAAAAAAVGTKKACPCCRRPFIVSSPA